MRLQTITIFVDDQQRAADFYTGVLGFEVMADHPRHTAAPPERPAATDISLEPKSHPAVGPFTDALIADGIPSAVLGVDDIEAEHERLVGLGVEFTQPPTSLGPVTVAVFDD